MPVVSLLQDHLFQKLGRKYSEDEMTELCFDYGLELDEITSEKEIVAKEKGDKCAVDCSSDLIYKIDVPANRYDLLCTEGLTRALQIFQEKIDAPVYRKSKPEDIIQLRVSQTTQNVRPYVVAAVLRNVVLDKARYDSLIDLQEKLHQNICRKRKLVAIGTHDLDSLSPPFLYDAVPPSEIHFVPLNAEKSYSAVELMDLYSSNSHLKQYLHLIKDEPNYPLITDKNGVVLSMPPIINGDHSKVKTATKNIFIECTATDLTKAVIVLDTLVTMYSEYCGDKFSIEPVEVIQHDGSKHVFPNLDYRNEIVSVDYVNGLLGTQLSEESMAHLLTRMGLNGSVVSDKPANCPSTVDETYIDLTKAGAGLVSVKIPPTRHDILHACDIAEDVAIALSYDKIEEQLPQTYCIAGSQPINRLTNLLRPELAHCGFTEALSFSLCSKADISTKLRQNLEALPAVYISNPKTSDFQVVRTTLLPGILHTVNSNKSLPLPLKLFEIQDVVMKDSEKDVGCRNERQLCIVHYSKTSGFEIIHGMLDRIMQLLEVTYVGDAKGGCGNRKTYNIESATNPTFFDKRCAKVTIQPGNKCVGYFGVLHPEVIKNFELTMPCSALELNLEAFL